MFKKGNKVIVAIFGPGECASTSGEIAKVKSSTAKGVKVNNPSYENMLFDKDGYEADPSFPGMYARLISVEE